MIIYDIKAREILDSRGNPTIESEVLLQSGTVGDAKVPSGASTGEKEAVELRDKDMSRYNGKGVLIAVNNINTQIAQALKDASPFNQNQIDKIMIKLDGTANKANLGANATLAVSLAVARAAAQEIGIPLYRYIGGLSASRLPIPCLNVINGGKHAENNIDFQEFMIAPHNAPNFKSALRMGIETFHRLKEILNKKGYCTAVGDEGGFAPNLKSNEEAIEIILEAINKAGYNPGEDISLCLDPATSELWEENGYHFFKSTKEKKSPEEMISLWSAWARQYPILSIEDAMSENDWNGWKMLTEELGNRIELVGDDLFCTNKTILTEGISKGIANSILIKPNQIGTLSETLATIHLATQYNYSIFISHRSGETEDPFIADLAVATNAGKIKAGSGCRSERISKFNRLLKIEEELGDQATFSGKTSFKNARM